LLKSFAIIGDPTGNRTPVSGVRVRGPIRWLLSIGFHISPPKNPVDYPCNSCLYKKFYSSKRLKQQKFT